MVGPDRDHRYCAAGNARPIMHGQNIQSSSTSKDIGSRSSDLGMTTDTGLCWTVEKGIEHCCSNLA
jgi:hypothetical protein